MFDYVPANDHVCLNLSAILIVITFDELQTAVEFNRRSDVTGIEAITANAGGWISDQLAKKDAVAAPNLRRYAIPNVALIDEQINQSIQVFIERRRTGLRILITLAIDPQCWIECPIENKAARFANCQGQCAACDRDRRSVIRHQKILPDRDLVTPKKLAERV